MPIYIPKQGDIAALSFDPQSGHEQAGRQPALVISKDAFNEATGMVMCCPLTKTNRNFPFHVAVTQSSSLTGFVMCEQLKSLDYKSRKITFIEKASKNLLSEVLAIVDACLFERSD